MEEIWIVCVVVGSVAIPVLALLCLVVTWCCCTSFCAKNSGTEADLEWNKPSKSVKERVEQDVESVAQQTKTYATGQRSGEGDARQLNRPQCNQELDQQNIQAPRSQDLDNDFSERYCIVKTAMERTEDFGNDASLDNVSFRVKDDGTFELWPFVRKKHFVKAPISVSAAVAVSYLRYDDAYTNTVFEDPTAFDLINFPDHGQRIVSCTRVRTVQCRKGEFGWSGREEGCCYAVFDLTGHLMYRTSLDTAI